MGTPNNLLPALRQYRHNNGEGLVFGYDKKEVEKLVSELQEMLEGRNKTISSLCSSYLELKESKQYCCCGECPR